MWVMVRVYALLDLAHPSIAAHSRSKRWEVKGDSQGPSESGPSGAFGVRRSSNSNWNSAWPQGVDPKEGTHGCRSCSGPWFHPPRSGLLLRPGPVLGGQGQVQGGRVIDRLTVGCTVVGLGKDHSQIQEHIRIGNRQGDGNGRQLATD